MKRILVIGLLTMCPADTKGPCGETVTGRTRGYPRAVWEAMDQLERYWPRPAMCRALSRYHVIGLESETVDGQGGQTLTGERLVKVAVPYGWKNSALAHELIHVFQFELDGSFDPLHEAAVWRNK